MKVTLSWICFVLLNMNCSIGQTTDNPVCFNHSLLVLDSTTYQAAVNSDFIHKHFAFSYEKELSNYTGFYLIGKTNYLELFNPRSIIGQEMDKGEIWICLASLKAQYIKTLNKEKSDYIQFELNDQNDYLNLKMNDSVSPITLWEMKKKYFESWTKKDYYGSINFSPVDYNSPSEADSSNNYLMNDITGIGLSLHSGDRDKVIRYLQEVGYDSASKYNGAFRLYNGHQFFELHISEEVVPISINRFYIQLNKDAEQSTEIIGNSRIEIDGKSAIWFFQDD